MSNNLPSRRSFLATVSGAVLAVSPRMLAAHSLLGAVQGGHPEPREGIDASRVLPVDQLSQPAAAPVYDMVREIPQIVDGIRCNCGCDEIPAYYSLLTCYEADGMAQWCDICQGQARLVYRLHKEGKTLDEIRRAVDGGFSG